MTAPTQMPDEIWVIAHDGFYTGPVKNGIKYLRADLVLDELSDNEKWILRNRLNRATDEAHDRRVSELLDANNKLLERARRAEANLKAIDFRRLLNSVGVIDERVKVYHEDIAEPQMRLLSVMLEEAFSTTEFPQTSDAADEAEERAELHKQWNSMLGTRADLCARPEKIEGLEEAIQNAERKLDELPEGVKDAIVSYSGSLYSSETDASAAACAEAGAPAAPEPRSAFTAPAGDVLTIADYEKVLADKRRLTREIDAALNGKNAAKQASLCDILAQIKREGIKSGQSQALRVALDEFKQIKAATNNKNRQLSKQGIMSWHQVFFANQLWHKADKAIAQIEEMVEWVE